MKKLQKLTPEIITLHRYFIWADRMRVHFDRALKTIPADKPTLSKELFEKDQGIETFMYMSLWYGTFYVLIDGWIKLKLKDERIDAFLKSKNVDLLREYRNGTFHFQKKYYDKHFMELMEKGDDFANWIRQLREEFSRWFLEIHGVLQNSPKL